MNAPKLKIGLLGLTLGFYERSGPDIRQGREAWVRQAVIPALSEGAEVRFERACYRREDIARTVAEYEQAGCDVLLVMLLTYSTSLDALPGLQQARLPIVIWNTQELFAVGEDFDQTALIANHGVHGTFDLANVLVRAGVRFDYLTSHLDDAGAAGEVLAHCRGAAAASRLRRMRLGLLGWPFPGMGDFGLDTTHLAATLGCAWEAVALSDYHRRVAGAEPDRVESLVEQYQDAYQVADDVTGADLAATARAEIALRDLAAAHDLDAVSYQFLAFGDDERTETVPFVAASRLLAEGVGFGGEGDLISAAFSTVLNWLQPPASFSEIFTTDFAGNAVLLSHMGEANVAMAGEGTVPLVKRPEPIVPVSVSQLALAVCYRPGAATLCVLTQGPACRWRIIAARGRILEFGPLPHLHVPHSKFAPDGDVRDFLTAYATGGGPHHLAVCYGDATDKLRTLARVIDADYVEI